MKTFVEWIIIERTSPAWFTCRDDLFGSVAGLKELQKAGPSWIYNHEDINQRNNLIWILYDLTVRETVNRGMSRLQPIGQDNMEKICKSEASSSWLISTLDVSRSGQSLWVKVGLILATRAAVTHTAAHVKSMRLEEIPVWWLKSAQVACGK